MIPAGQFLVARVGDFSARLLTSAVVSVQDCRQVHTALQDCSCLAQLALRTREEWQAQTLFGQMNVFLTKYYERSKRVSGFCSHGLGVVWCELFSLLLCRQRKMTGGQGVTENKVCEGPGCATDLADASHLRCGDVEDDIIARVTP